MVMEAIDAVKPVRRGKIEPRPEFAKILRIDETFATDEASGLANAINRRFDRLIVQSHVDVTPKVALRLCVLAALVCGGSMFIASESFLLTAAAAAIGAASPIIGMQFQRRRRLKVLRAQLPPLVQGMAQSARGGCGLVECLEIAALDSPYPLRDEIEPVVRRLRLGVGVEDALHDLPERTGLPEIGLLTAALALHHRTGGELVAALERVGRVLQNRRRK